MFPHISYESKSYDRIDSKIVARFRGHAKKCVKMFVYREGGAIDIDIGIVERSGDMQGLFVAYSGRGRRCETITTNSDITVGQCVCGQ